MSKLLRELTEERKTQQNLREDHASKTAEQTEQKRGCKSAHSLYPDLQEGFAPCHTFSDPAYT